jgi:OOP family OmpA-OmpF porin
MRKQMTNATTRRAAAMVAMAAFVAAMQGCATPGAAIDQGAQARAAAAQPAPPKPADFPAADSARWKQGAFPGAGVFDRIRPGMGKDQMRGLLGWPHFSEGLWGVREWNYLFHFRTGNGMGRGPGMGTSNSAAYVTCQYMVRFDSEGLSTGGWWKDLDCALLAQPPAAVPIPTVAVAAAAAVALVPTVAVTTDGIPRKRTLATDGLFRFDGASLTDLLPAGRARLERLADELRRDAGAQGAIVVTGHTDRLGSDAYDDALSLERANTVRDLLVQQGIERKRVRTVGMGKREPLVVDCRGTRSTLASPALLRCLQPNRRVEIAVAAGARAQ